MAIDENGLIGATISGYRLLEILGAGGMGVVYKARSLSSSQYVAIKILLPIEAAPLQNGMTSVFVTDNAVEDKPGGGGTAVNLYQGYFLAKHQSTGWKLAPDLRLVSSQGICEHTNML